MMDKLRETKLKLIYFHNSEGFIKYVKMHLTGGATLKHTRNENMGISVETQSV